jgi:hypothetical protein
MVVSFEKILEFYYEFQAICLLICVFCTTALYHFLVEWYFFCGFILIIYLGYN